MNSTNLFGHDDIRSAIVGRFAQQPATKQLSPGAARIVYLAVKAMGAPSRQQSPMVKAILKRMKAIR